MPAHIVEGTDLDDVAAYVGKYAGVPGVKPPEVEGGAGAQVFAEDGLRRLPHAGRRQLRRRHRS